MTRIRYCFNQLAATHRKGLIPYLVAGDPHPAVTVRLMHRMVDNGANLIELGVPFSDPMVDGKVIQGGHERALAQGVNLKQVLAMVRDFRRGDAGTPIILMSYLNPVAAMGYSAFAGQAAQAGVDGVILVDLPPEADSGADPGTDPGADSGADGVETCHLALQQQGIDQIFLLAPNTTDERVSLIARRSGGYVYYVSLKGVTGSTTLDITDVARRLKQIRQRISIPLAIGFGVQNGSQAAHLARLCDAVVIGSAVVQRIGERGADEASLLAVLGEFLGAVRGALDAENPAA